MNMPLIINSLVKRNLLLLLLLMCCFSLYAGGSSTKYKSIAKVEAILENNNAEGKVYGEVHVKHGSAASESDGQEADSGEQNDTNAGNHTYHFLAVTKDHGYKWDGWYYINDVRRVEAADGRDSIRSEAISFSKNATETWTWQGHWIRRKFDVTLSANGESQTISATYDSIMPSTLAAGGAIVRPSKTGYNFSGYFDNISGGKQYYNADLSSANNWDKASIATLYAQWSPKTYTITLNGNGGTGHTANVTATYNSNTLSSSITNPTKTGYTFGGWYSDEGGTGSLVINTSGVLQEVDGYTGEDAVWTRDAATALYAKWTAIDYTVTLNNQSADTGHEGTASLSVTYDSNTNLTDAIDVPSKDGYTFEGYYSNTSGGGVQVIDKSGNVLASAGSFTDASKNWKYASDKTLYAYWKQNQTITWDQTISNPVRSTVIELSASASSELGVTYTATSDGGTVSIDNSSTPRKLTCLTAGNVTVTAHQAGNASWNAAVEVTQTFTITEHAITNVPTATAITYEQALLSSDLSGGTASVSGEWSWDNASTKPNAGTANHVAVFTPDNTSGAFTASDTLHCNVSVTVNRATPDITKAAFAEWYEVDHDPLDLQDLWQTEGDGSVSYSIVADSFEESGENNDDGTDPDLDEDKRYLSLGKAGTLTIQMTIGNNGANYTGRTVTQVIEIRKHTNALKCAWNSGSAGDDWDETVGFDDSIKVKFTNTALDAPAIEVTPVVGTTQYATRKEGTSTNPDTLVAHHNIGNAVWSVVQPENYKYARTAANCTLRVNTETTTCYVLDDPDDNGSPYSWGTGGQTKAFSLSDDGAKLSFKAWRDWGGANYFYVQTSTTGTADSDFSNFMNPDLETSEPAEPLTYDLPANVKHVRFITVTGATLKKYVKDVKVTRKTWFKIQNVSKEDIDALTIPTNVIGGVKRRATFYVDYSTCDSEIKLVSSHPRIKFAASDSTIYSFLTNGVHGRKAIELVYTSNDTEEEDLEETITIYTRYEHETLDVEAHTEKHTQTFSWKERIGVLSLNDTVANAFTSILSAENGVTYTRLEGEGLNDAITITHDSLIATKTGTSRIRAYVAGNDLYKEIAETIDIRVTDSLVQYIVWTQDRELRRLKLGGSNLKLTAYATSAIDTCTTNGKRDISYSSSNESVVRVDNEKKELIIVGAGTTTVTASVDKGEDADKHVYIAAELTKDVIVRDPSAPCGDDEIYNNSSELKIDCGTGDPLTVYFPEIDLSGDELGYYSFQYKGETHTAWFTDYLDGQMSVEQYVDDEWKLMDDKLTKITTDNKSTYYTVTGTLDKHATKMRMKAVGKGYFYYKNLVILRSRYIEVTDDDIVIDTLAFSSFIGTSQVKTVNVRWSDSRGDILLSLPAGAPFTLNSEDLLAECNGIDNTDVSIDFKTMVGQTDSCYNLVLSDGVTTKTIVLKASATAEVITFDGESWSNTPSEYKVANVAENADLTISTEVAMYSLSIATGATVTVTAEGGLSVGAGGITNASSNKIKLESNTDGMTGYIRVSPDYKGVMPEADVELFTQAYYNRNEKDSEKRMAKMQYIGVPVDKENYAATSLFSSQTYVYSWSESAGNWVNNKRSLKVAPFAGYSITQYDVENGGEEIEFSGKLVAPRDTTIELAYSGSDYSGRNFLANSYAAPIDISRFSYSDFSLEDEEDTSVDYAIYLFNTGAKGEYKDGVESPASLTAAGQYITVSPGTVTRLKGLDPSYPIVIPAMQGFFVKTNAAGKSLTLNYSRLVWNADYEKHGNEKMRVQRRAAEEGQEETDEELGGAMKISLYSSRAVDHIYLLESEDYSKSFENGYDGRKMLAGELNIYAIEGEEALAIDATDDLEGTKLGIRTGLDDADTIVFSRVQNVENLYLHDRYTGIYTLIEEGATYGFYADPDSYLDDRFEIIGFGSQGSATGVGNEKVDNNATKYIKDNTLFILKNGIKYNSLGQKVQ